MYKMLYICENFISLYNLGISFTICCSVHDEPVSGPLDKIYDSDINNIDFH